MIAVAPQYIGVTVEPEKSLCVEVHPIQWPSLGRAQ